MKTIRTLVIASFIFIGAGFSKKSFAQGNLQFNQVILYDIPGNTSQSITVPAGKVWKIESASTSHPCNSIYLLNSSGQYIAQLYIPGNANLSSSSLTLPYWLPSSFSGSFRVGDNCVNRGSVSIIEFNVIP